MSEYPVWVEVCQDALENNLKEIRRVVKPKTQILAVVKANGYGHGALEVSRIALANGATWLGVARVSEGVALRQAGLEVPILVLGGYIPPDQAEQAIRYQLSQAVYSREMALSLAEAAVRCGARAKIHLKVDTGMGRIGLLAGPDALEEILQIARIPHIDLEGIFTHFANADAADKSYTKTQLERFEGITEALRKNGLDIPLKHAANSAALMEMPETHLDMVRAGIIIYGLYPSVGLKKAGFLKLRQAMSLKARVAQVKRVPAGFKVSYRCMYTTAAPTTIVTLPLGYADGYPRQLSSKGEVLLCGRRRPVVGLVCMDHLMVDAGSNAFDIAVGDEAVLIGKQRTETISADELAVKLNTIHYEVICMISLRVPRIYLA